MTNGRSYDLRQLDNPDLDDLHLGNLTLPHPHIGLILIKFIIDGPKLLVNVTQPWLMGLGITRADHLATTRFVLEKIRLRSPTYQHHQKHILNPIPMLSTQTAGPQSHVIRQAVLDSIHQQIATKPLKDGETRNYHLVFGCFVAVVTGPNGQYNLFFKTVSQCLETEHRRDSLSLQSSAGQQLRRSQAFQDGDMLGSSQRRASVSFHGAKVFVHLTRGEADEL